jgi:hypothetical protein
MAEEAQRVRQWAEDTADRTMKSLRSQVRSAVRELSPELDMPPDAVEVACWYWLADHLLRNIRREGRKKRDKLIQHTRPRNVVLEQLMALLSRSRSGVYAAFGTSAEWEEKRRRRT